MDNELALMQELTDTQGPSFSVYIMSVIGNKSRRNH